MEENRIDYFLKVMTAGVPVSFIISYGFHVAFLMRIGIFFFDMPISLADISKGALAAMPIVLIFGLGSITVNVFLPWFADKRDQNQSIISVDNDCKSIPPKLPRIFYITYFIVILSSICFVLIFSSVAVIANLVILGLVGYVGGRYRHIFGTAKTVVYLTIPTLFAASLSAGDFRAWLLMASPPNATINMADGTSTSTALLGTYEAGILTFEGGRPHFIKWDGVKGITYQKVETFPSILCDVDHSISTIEFAICKSR